MKAHKKAEVDIGIKTFNICKSMMAYIVLYLPVIRISTHGVQDIDSGLIHPGMFRKALMASLMHNIETDQSQVHPKKTAKDDTYGNRWGEKYKNDIKDGSGTYL